MKTLLSIITITLLATLADAQTRIFIRVGIVDGGTLVEQSGRVFIGTNVTESILAFSGTNVTTIVNRARKSLKEDTLRTALLLERAVQHDEDVAREIARSQKLERLQRKYEDESGDE